MREIKEGWNVDIEKSRFGFTNIFIYFRSNGSLKFLVLREFGMAMIPHEEGREPDPTIALSHFDAEDILKELAAALNEKGIVTPNEAKTSGLLEAKDSHLSDMRKIVGKTLDVNL